MLNRILKLAGAAAAMAVTGALAFTVPLDVKLGALVRFVTFHGASTWVNMALFTVFGVLGIVFLVRPREGLARWESAVRYVALPLWMVNTALGTVSSRLAWGGINWAEPRMQASFYVLIAAACVVVVQHLIDRPRVTAALDAVLAGSAWGLLLYAVRKSAEMAMHPDSPVLHSGWDVKGPFAGMVLCWGIAMALIVWSARDAIVAWHATEHARNASGEPAAASAE